MWTNVNNINGNDIITRRWLNRIEIEILMSKIKSRWYKHLWILTLIIVIVSCCLCFSFFYLYRSFIVCKDTSMRNIRFYHSNQKQQKKTEQLSSISHQCYFPLFTNKDNSILFPLYLHLHFHNSFYIMFILFSIFPFDFNFYYIHFILFVFVLLFI